MACDLCSGLAGVSTLQYRIFRAVGLELRWFGVFESRTASYFPSYWISFVALSKYCTFKLTPHPRIVIAGSGEELALQQRACYVQPTCTASASFNPGLLI